MRTDASLLVDRVPDARDGYADLDTVRLHYVTAGAGISTNAADAPLVVLVHGFPDFWYTWRRQIGPLASAGFRVVAVDLRGYNLSDKPKGVAHYGTRVVAKDIADLIDSLGAKRAHVVGHDWGAGIAWAFAMEHAGRLDRLALLNGPHHANMIKAMKDPVQLARSWYVFCARASRRSSGPSKRASSRSGASTTRTLAASSRRLRRTRCRTRRRSSSRAPRIGCTTKSPRA